LAGIIHANTQIVPIPHGLDATTASFGSRGACNNGELPENIGLTADLSITVPAPISTGNKNAKIALVKNRLVSFRRRSE
jgi:hypothetical protein